MAKPEVPESLQCLACAIRQETGLVTEPILETAMLGMKKLPEAINTKPRDWVLEDWPDLTQMEIFKNG